MATYNTDVTQERYDVVVVGSGAAGGTAAYVLTRMGLKVLMLEAGRMIDQATDMTPHYWPWEYPFRGNGAPGRFDGLWKFNEGTSQLYTNPRNDPYAEEPGMPFHWTRLRGVGGRTLTWGAAVCRMGPLDFKTLSRQGYGCDWPIDYPDLAPYYDRVERLIGINGDSEEVFNVPKGPFHLPALKPRCGENFIRRRAARIGVKAATMEYASITAPYNGRNQCHYCAHCWLGCQVGARFSSLDVLIPWLLEQKNFTLRTHAAVHQVLPDRNGTPRGVSFVDSATGKDYEVKARAVVLGASTVETCRILLNSKSRFHPQGLGNDTEQVGHYITDFVKSAGGVSGYLPLLKGRPIVNEDGKGEHIYFPRFNYKFKNDYYGGYILIVVTKFGTNTAAGQVPGYGASFKRGVRDLYGTGFGMVAFGERLPEYDNYVEIDPGGLKDRLGIPQVRFHVKNRENEFKMMADMFHWKEKILRACDAEILPFKPGLAPPGDATQESGGARMGDDPKTSVVNRFNQVHGIKNLFVVDASSFVTVPASHGLTSTAMALSWRASDYLAYRMRTGEIA